MKHRVYLMLRIEDIQELTEAWVKVPTLTSAQISIVEAFRDVARKGSIEEFFVFKHMLWNQYPDDIIQAIVKARAEGLGAKKY